MKEIFMAHPAYSLMAWVGTLLFVLKMLLMFVGGDDVSDFDGESFEDIDHIDGGDQFSVVSIQSILAFFMGAGWIGLAATEEWNLSQMESVGASAGFGFLMMLLSSFLTMKIRGLNSEQNKFNIKSAVGKTGRAYTNIPKKGEGLGQVEIVLQGKNQILQAVSNGEEIKSFDSVIIKSVDESGRLTVETAKES